MFRRLWVVSCLLVGAAMVSLPIFSRISDVRAAKESVANVRLYGKIIELSTTEAPTTVVLRVFAENGSFTDHTIDIDGETRFGGVDRDPDMSHWIVRDWAIVEGEQNLNTLVVAADEISNASIDPNAVDPYNGWVESVDVANSILYVGWQDTVSAFRISSRTQMLIGSLNPASLSDFMIGDRVRGRLFEGTNEARVVFALRRGDENFAMGRTRPFRAKLISMRDALIPTLLEVELGENAHLRPGDPNNLIGSPGDRVMVRVIEDTRLVRRFAGSAEIAAFLPGDALYIVGYKNDDGTITAKLVRDDAVVSLETEGVSGEEIGG